MAKAVKSFAVNVTANGSTTVYTCPASTSAKVILGYLLLTGTTATATDVVASMTIGFQTISASSTGNPTTVSREFGGVAALSSASNVAQVDTNLVPAEAVFYLTAGQTITTSISGAVSGSAANVKAQITVLEA